MRNSVKFTLFLVLFLLPIRAFATIEIYQNWCQQGGQQVANGGINSSTRVQRSFQNCTITVYNAGTINTAAIYSDTNGTPLTNPFTICSVSCTQTTSTGQYFFYANNGYYDIQINGVGLSVYTLHAIGLGGSGGVSVNCGASQGSDISFQVQNCFNALPITGGTAEGSIFSGPQSWSQVVSTSKPVKLRLCAVTITSSVTSSSGALTMTGEGSSIEGCGPSATVLQVNNTSGYGINALAPKMTISNITVRGACTTSCATLGLGVGINSGSTDDVRLNNVVVEKWNAIGLNTGGNAHNWNIANSIFQDNWGDAVFLASGTGHLVHGNTIRRNGSNAIDINSSSSVVILNYISANGFNLPNGGIDSNGIVISSIQGNTDDNYIADNEIYGSTGNCVRLRADALNSASRNTIHHNMCNGNGQGGFLIDVSIGVTCGTTNNNTFDHNTSVGTPGGRGDYVIGGGGGTCTANGNTFDTNYALSTAATWGIFLNFGTGGKVINNTALGPATPILISPSTAGMTMCNTVSLSVACPVDNLTPSPGSNIVNITSSGNTELLFTSSAGGSGRYAAVLDNLGDFNPALNVNSGVNHILINGSDNMTLTSNPVTTINSTANTELLYNSSAGGTRQYASLIDNSGNFYPAFDITGGSPRITVNSSGNTNVTGSFSVGAGGQFSKTFIGVAILDFPNTAAQQSSDLTIAVTGVVDQDTCMLGPPSAIVGVNDHFWCFVSGANTVTVRFDNYSSGAINPGSGQFKISLIHF